MVNDPRVFLDSSVLFAAVLSETGGARLILKLGEAGALSLWLGPQALRETDGVLMRKAPESKSLFALLLDQAGVEIGPAADAAAKSSAEAIVDYVPDALILAEALAAKVDYFVTFDRQHFIDNPRISELPFFVGTPGDFLAWFREWLKESGE